MRQTSNGKGLRTLLAPNRSTLALQGAITADHAVLMHQILLV